MNVTFLMASTSSIAVQSLGKIVQRALAVDAKTWCLYVFVTLRSWCTVRSTVTYFEQVLCRSLLVDFDGAYIAFFSIDCSFKCTR